MAYDFGANTLGIKNPFKFEGFVKLMGGVLICALAVVPLLGISEALKQDMVKAWVNAGLGLILLIWGLQQSGIGLFQMFKYFVGRSVPTSLAQNFNPSERENAQQEEAVTEYQAEELESMLMGRKNSTFKEPIGWTARLIHTLLPRLIFTPYPIRNFVQELGSLVVTSVMALVVFAVAYFVSVSGLVGDAGTMITPILSVMLLLYLIMAWRAMASSLVSARNRQLHSKNAAGIAKLLVIAIVIPVALGYLYAQFSEATRQELALWFDNVLVFSAWGNLALLFVISLAVIAASAMMIRERFTLAQPKTEVAEFRENLQESVHPNEIFINIENIVLANRRYKEIPNRIYQGFEPVLQEQSQGKGNFRGQLLIETQPEVHEMEYSNVFKQFRMLSTLVGQALVVVAALLFYFMIGSAYEVYAFASERLTNLDRLADSQMMAVLAEFGPLASSLLVLFFSWQTVLAGGRILERGTHLFWSEMQFSSLLMWMKTEGTYTESKISTGMAIHDSTRSENVVVRSSITPWIITSRITTSTFATSGTRNLEMPRYVLSLSKNTDELDTIVKEIKGFLRGREAIASITNEKDLHNAETIFQVNQASRAPMLDTDKQQKLEEAGAFRRIEEDPSAADDSLDQPKS
ncbi:hypothetical protein [Bowmanella denitrificans]|uniref:hypothetical protein n=1 Tax=Bowmanella denitrificans TaxID=366582 RepID=UPI000C9C839B|nr:hypothetical protein [Bowmanella denitrificans]